MSIGSSGLGSSGARLGSIELGSVGGEVGAAGTISLTDILSLSDNFINHLQSRRTIILSQSLILIDGFNTHLHDIAITQTLPFVDRFNIGKGYKLSLIDNLYLTESFIKGGTIGLSISDTLSLSEGNFSYTIDNHIVVLQSFNIIQKQDYLTLSSPYATIVLEPPIFGDAEASLNEVYINTAISGKRYSYIRTQRKRHLRYELQFRRQKYLEFKNFIDVSNLEWLTLTNQKSEVWTVQIVNNPIEFIAIDREYYSTVLEFQGYRLVNGLYQCLE